MLARDITKWFNSTCFTLQNCFAAIIKIEANLRIKSLFYLLSLFSRISNTLRRVQYMAMGQTEMLNDPIS